MNRKLLPVAAALVSLFGAATAQAQSNSLIDADATLVPRVGTIRPGALPGGIRDGTSNTLVIGERLSGSLTTNATVSGNITQSGNPTGGNNSAVQLISIGGARELGGAVGTITTQGTLVGNVTQNRSGSIGLLASQSVHIGAVQGEVSASRVTATGTVQANITQSAEGTASRTGGQTVGVGRISDASGGTIGSNAVLTGAGVAQTSRSGASQELSIADVRNSQLQSGNAAGTVSASVVQSTASVSNTSAIESQRVVVGSIAVSQVASVSTQGQLLGAVTQTRTGSSIGMGVNQTVSVGAVSGVDAAGTVNTNAVLNATVLQSASAGRQSLLVGDVAGGSPTSATTNAVVNGTVTQANSGVAGVQTMQLGSILAVSGQVRTDVTINGELHQTLNSAGGNRTQELSIGSAEGTAGTVNTRASVNGIVSQSSQSANGRTQRISIGSVQGAAAGVVNTEVVINGNVTQSAGSNGRDDQTILIGGVSTN